MKNTLLIIMVAAIALPGFASADQATVLFIGNSHTYYNDLPELFDDLAGAGGHNAYVDESTFGGATLQNHSTHPTTRAKIDERRWNHVVLQEHSLYPAIEHLRDTSFYPAAHALDALIGVQGSGTTLFMTWGWENGGELCVGQYCSPDFPDYFAMQTAVSEAYRNLNEELGSFLVPVGEFWAAALREDPKSPLWNGDHYHPSPEGSYLAACVFYARIFDESPEGVPFYGGIDQERAEFYQRIAGRAITAGPAGSPPAPALSVHPNPFNPSATISFDLSESAPVSLEIFDAAGRLVDKIELGTLGAGAQSVVWAAESVASGTYVVRLRAGDRSCNARLTLIK